MGETKILIVDDDPGVCEILKDIFDAHDYLPQYVHNGKDALNALINENIDVALFDIQLPDCDGTELLRKAKKINPDMVCALITGNASVKNAVECLRDGAIGYFVKPFSVEEVLHDIHEALEKVSLEKRLESSQTQLFQNEKMAVIGQLAAGVAHEINNPIGFINSNLSTLAKYVQRLEDFIGAQSEALEEVSVSTEKKAEIAQSRKKLKIDYILEDSKDLVEESLEGADRIKKIVQDLKLFSREDQGNLVLANINDSIESALNIIWNELKYTCKVNKDFGELPQTYCMPQKLSQVFMNILVNAGHSIEQEGVITIKSWFLNGTIIITIADNGCGMSPDVQEKIFEPFFTTKDVGKGTGLGMSIAAEIIKIHDGTIKLVSMVGEGTSFTICIPVKETDEEDQAIEGVTG